MKTALITAALFTLSIGLATAAEVKVTAPRPDMRQFYTCATGGLSRVALRPDTVSQAAPCCDGMLGCPQLLANTGLVKPKRDNRT